MAKKTILEELQDIEQEYGILRPENVVEYPQNKRTSLHSQFTWDDGEAAKRYRLWQARVIINATVTVIERDEQKFEVQAFVSLTPDRRNEGGGYRSITTVMTDAEMKAQMLKDALSELRGFQRKYRELSQLSKVFEAIEQLRFEPERELVAV